LLGQKYWIRYCLRGKRIEEPTDAENETEARKVLNDRLGKVGNGITPAVASRTRLRELYDDMRADYLNNEAGVSILEKRWKHLEPVFGSDLVAAITSGRIRHYVTVRRDTEKAAPATVQREIAALRRMFRLGYQATPPKVGQLPSFPKITEQNVRTGFFERDEFERVRAELPDYLRPLVTVGYWLGWRIGKLQALQWRPVDLERGTIRLDAGTTKNDEGRLAYLPPEALEVLEDWRSETAKLEKARGVIIPHVFHHDGSPIRDIYAAWRGACKRAGVAGRLFPRPSPHGCSQLPAPRRERRRGDAVRWMEEPRSLRALQHQERRRPPEGRRDGRRKPNWEELGKTGQSEASKGFQTSAQCWLTT
jgi:integrase